MAHILHVDSMYPFHVPIPPLPLIGRDQEVHDLITLLHSNVRLVTLTGTGGVGKTHLTLQVASQMQAYFADGIAFVSLAPISNPDLLLSTIAQALHLKEVGNRPLVDLLKASLRHKHLLLLLDNFEQIIQAAPQVADLLAACAHLKILMTSRVLLRLRSEHEFHVSPLAVPDPSHLPANERLAQFAAVALFVQQVRRVLPDFQITSANTHAIAELCVRLDGLPLALELAAARIKLLSPQALLARLSRRLTILTSGTRDAPERQQTLRETIAWSYHLLTSQEQRLFQRLSVFVRGGTLEAIAAICGVDGEQGEQIMDAVHSLLDQSLLQVQRQEGAEPRFLMLETIREYALECLERSGEEEIIREAHAQYYLAYAEKAAPELMRAEQTLWFRCLDLECENIRAALNWFIVSGNGIGALRLSSAIWLFWAHLHLSEGYQWIERSLALSQECAMPADISLQAHAHTALASLAYYMGNWQQMSMHLDQCVQLFQSIDDKAGIAVTRNTQALLALEQEDYTALPALVEEALALKQYIKVPWFVAETLYIAALLSYTQKDFQRASALGEETLAYCRKFGEPSALALSLNALGLFAYARGEEEAASAWYCEVLKVIGPLEKEDGASIKTASLLGLAGIAAGQGHYRWATQLWGAVEALRKRIEGTIGDKRRQWLNTMVRRQSNYDQMVKVARAQLGEEAFSVAWAQGQALTMEQILAELENIGAHRQQQIKSAAPSAQPAAPSPVKLTRRERDVLRLLVQGLTNAQIAEQLVITKRTVNWYLTDIYSKLGVSSRFAAIHYAREHHLID